MIKVYSQIIESLFASEQSLIQNSFRAILTPSNRISADIDFVLVDFDNTTVGMFQFFLPTIVMLRLQFSNFEPCAQDKHIIWELQWLIWLWEGLLFEGLPD